MNFSLSKGSERAGNCSGRSFAPARFSLVRISSRGLFADQVLLSKEFQSIGVGVKIWQAPDAPSKRTIKIAPSKRTLLTSFQWSLAEPPQQAAAGPTTHTRSDEE